MKTTYTIAADEKTLVAERSFTTTLEAIWSAWSEQAKLEQWWAPLPWRAVTESFDFTEGGKWHYHMAGPEGEKHWCLTSYLLIIPQASFSALDSFCNEIGEIDTKLPANHFEVQFDAEGDKVTVTVTTTYANPADLQTVLTMGIKEGFNQGLDQLETLLLNN